MRALTNRRATPDPLGAYDVAEDDVPAVAKPLGGGA